MLTIHERLLRSSAVAVMVVYAMWQIFWLSGGHIPPSLCVALTGLPSPTTGGTRSFKALLSGDILLSLYHNTMTVPFVCLFLFTAGWAVFNWRRLGTNSLPRLIVRSWLVALTIAWLVKLCQVMW